MPPPSPGAGSRFSVYLVYLVVAPFLAPLAWAGVFAVVFYPIHAQLATRWGPGRAAAATTFAITAILIVPMVVVAGAFVREGIDATARLQAGLVQGMASLERAWEAIEQRLPASLHIDLTSLAVEGVRNAAGFLVAQSGSLVRNVAGFAVDLALALFATFFLLRDSPAIMRVIRRLMPMDEPSREATLARTRELISVGVVSAGIVASVQGFLGGLVFALLGIQSAVFWGVVMGLCCLLPFGAWVVWLPASIVLAVGGSVGRAILLAALGFGNRQRGRQRHQTDAAERAGADERPGDLPEPARRHRGLRHARRSARSGAGGDGTRIAVRLRGLTGRSPMSEPGYTAARAVTPRSAGALRASHREDCSVRCRAGEEARSCPTPTSIEAIIDAAFWASLRREEGYVPKISLALLSPDQAIHPLLFERPLPLSPRALVAGGAGGRAARHPPRRLAASEGELRVWGTTRDRFRRSASCWKSPRPGLLVVKHHRGDGGKFVNVAVLEGDQIKMIDEQRVEPARLSGPADVAARLRRASLVGRLGQRAGPARGLDARARTRRHRCWWCPPSTTAGASRSSSRFRTRSRRRSTTLADLLRRRRPQEQWRTASGRTSSNDAVQAVAGLTAVDGATVLTDRYELLAFGAKITRRKGSPAGRAGRPSPSRSRAARPPSCIRSQLGGTRHLSAAQFVHDQRDAVALVASQDGRFTVFAWSPCEECVHAHRVETLLL